MLHCVNGTSKRFCLVLLAYHSHVFLFTHTRVCLRFCILKRRTIATSHCSSCTAKVETFPFFGTCVLKAEIWWRLRGLYLHIAFSRSTKTASVGILLHWCCRRQIGGVFSTHRNIEKELESLSRTDEKNWKTTAIKLRCKRTHSTTEAAAIGQHLAAAHLSSKTVAAGASQHSR